MLKPPHIRQKQHSTPPTSRATAMSTTSAMTDRFNAEAAAWDSNPVTVRSSELAYKALLEHVPSLTSSSTPANPPSLQPRQTRLTRPPTEPNILEIGCGTGLLSLALSPHARALLGVDLAAGMVAAFAAKLAARGGGVANVAALATLLVDPDQPDVQGAARALLGGDDADAPVRWDLVVSHLTLHHIPRMADVLATVLASLRPGGRVALTDFEDFGPEAVWFHPASKRADVERHGIKRAEMAALMEAAGFVDVRVERAFVLEKEVDPAEAGGRTRLGFPFLVCLGRRPA